MNRTPKQQQGTNTRRVARSYASVASLHRQIKKLTHEVEGSVPRQIRARKQIEQIPTHNFNLKVRKWFRILHGVVNGQASAPIGVITTRIIRQGVNFELGVDFVDPEIALEKYTIHGGRVYTQLATFNTPKFVAGHSHSIYVEDLKDVNLVDENPAAAFESTATISGTCFSEWVEPALNRPSFSDDSGDYAYIRVYGQGAPADAQYQLVVDLEIEYIRTTSRGALFKHQSDQLLRAIPFCAPQGSASATFCSIDLQNVRKTPPIEPQTNERESVSLSSFDALETSNAC